MTTFFTIIGVVGLGCGFALAAYVGYLMLWK